MAPSLQTKKPGQHSVCARHANPHCGCCRPCWPEHNPRAVGHSRRRRCPVSLCAELSEEAPALPKSSSWACDSSSHPSSPASEAAASSRAGHRQVGSTLGDQQHPVPTTAAVSRALRPTRAPSRCSVERLYRAVVLLSLGGGGGLHPRPLRCRMGVGNAAGGPGKDAASDQAVCVCVCVCPPPRPGRVLAC